MFRRSILVAFLATALPGCLATHNEKIYTRRVPPTKEELDALPPEPYEAALRREAAQKQRLELPLAIHDETKFQEDARRELRAAARVSKDPWDSFEADRIRVLQSKNWADVGGSPPPEVFPRFEPPVEQDPFAPVAKTAKKKEEAPADKGDAPAPDAGDKGGEKKDAPKEAPKAGEPKSN